MNKMKLSARRMVVGKAFALGCALLLGLSAVAFAAVDHTVIGVTETYTGSAPVWNNVTVQGTNGVAGSLGGANGANAALNVGSVSTGSMHSTGNINVLAGHGGAGDDPLPITNGGDGGNSAVSIRGTLTMDPGRTLVVTSGTNGVDGVTLGGNGGNASFTAWALHNVGTITLTRSNGTLYFDGGHLAMTTRDTVINLTNVQNAANDRAVFQALTFDGGHGLYIHANAGSQGAFGAGNMRISGVNNHLYQNGALTAMSYNAAGQNLSFNFDGIVNGDRMLNVSGTNNGVPYFVNVADSTVHIDDVAGGGRAFRPGEAVMMIDTTQGLTATQHLTVQKGSTLNYFFDIDSSTGQLVARVADVKARPEAKSLSEGKLAGLAFVNQGGDLLVNQGIAAAMSSAKREGNGMSLFAVGQGGRSRYDTGSHLDVEGFSMLTGAAWNAGLPIGRLTLGAFFEAGWGNYDAHNSFARAHTVKGKGDTEYYGGGFLGRLDFNQGFYAETSFRMGAVDTDYHTDHLFDKFGNTATYDSTSVYYGAHAGLGYIWSINEQSKLDIYGKYLWTQQGSDDVSVTHDPIHFADANSHRLRGGARFSYDVTPWLTPYIGAAYEHEFDGVVKATTYGYPIDEPDMKGGTGIGEFGLTVKPMADGGFSMDLGVQGYIGTREGFTGSARMKYAF